jgi:luciferase family oxidoreductase group 1
MSFPLSILDLSPIYEGVGASQAVRNSVDLARYTDSLGYRRYWVAEHHNIPSISSTAPEVLIGQIAGVTRWLRVGAGGIMLPNHSPFHIAEVFRVLEALYPGRIDLGLGRAPGSDQLTALAMRRSRQRLRADDFDDQLDELQAYATRQFSPKNPFSSLEAFPNDVPLPPIWMLGSTDGGARIAASRGLGFAHAHHFSPDMTQIATRLYRQNFRPNAELRFPWLIVTVSVVCAETEEEAARLAKPLYLAWVRLRTGAPAPILSPDDATRYPYNDVEREMADYARRYLIVGTPGRAREQIETLRESTSADEIMVNSMINPHEARKNCYRLLTDAFELERTE